MILDSVGIQKILPHRYPFLMVDTVLEIERLKRIVSLKNVSIDEIHLQGHFPGKPILPGVLIIEGMAQTAGILVGEARNFQEKVILAKIGRATFHRLVRPGETLAFHAKIEQLSEHGASISGRVESGENLVAEIEMMFSHIDSNLSGVQFPEHNFVFTEQFTELLKTYRLQTDVTL